MADVQCVNVVKLPKATNEAKPLRGATSAGYSQIMTVTTDERGDDLAPERGDDLAPEDGSLAACLRDAAWRPRELARVVNDRLDRLGKGNLRIHLTTPYSWLRHGYCPYQPTADIVAEVLSERLGRPITAATLWPDRAKSATSPSSSADRLEPRWSFGTVAAELGGLARSGEAERQAIRPVRRSELVDLALDGVRHSPAPLAQVIDGDRVMAPMMDLIGDHIAALRRLDDRQGGGALSVRYVSGELSTLVGLIKRAAYDTDVGTRLYAAAADLAQLAGWMHFDAGAIGASQRYFFLGLRAARADRDPTSAANILGMLAYQTAQAGQGPEAIRLAEAAEAASRGTSRAMQARAAGRLATAHAAAGNLDGFRAAADRARSLLVQRDSGDAPPSLYYLSVDQLNAETGQGLVDLAGTHSRTSRRLLGEAVELLNPLSSAGPSVEYQRSALLHGCYLAQAHVGRGELEQACLVGRVAVERLPSVQSRRCRLLLRRLATSLAPRHRNPWVADFLPELRRAVG